MARLKFLVFSLVVLGLWAAHFFLLTPGVSARAVELARSGASSAPASVSSAIDARKGAVQRAALVVSSSAHAAAAFGTAGTAPPAEKLEGLRTAISDRLPVELRESLVLALAHPAGTVVAQGTGAAAEAPADFDVAAVTGAGVAGITRHAFGATQLFYAVPVEVLERGAPKLLGHVIVGAPLVTDALLEDAARAARIDGVALLSDGEVVLAAGAQKELARKLGPRAAPEKTDVVETGKVSTFGPVKLPILTAGDAMGGSAPLWIASRRALDGTPYELVTLASVAPFMSALGEYQRTALLIFAGMVVLSIGFLLILGGARKAQAAHAHETPARQEPAVAAQPAPAQSVAPLPFAEPAPAPEATPDDFPFGEPPAPQFASPPESDPEHLAAPELEPVPEPTPEPEHSPASAETEWAVPQHNAPPELPEEPPTRNVPLMNHAALFAEAQAAQEAQDAQEFNPEATRVATIPQELLQAATQAGYDPYPSVYQPAQFAPPPVQAASENQEEGHFQDVYREFLQTREACGEGGDGLTYEKFAVKLRKNRDQLVAKYHCRTVRFQVYVKEGKAALKATPIKD